MPGGCGNSAIGVNHLVVVVVMQGIRIYLVNRDEGRTSGSGRQHLELFFWGNSENTHQRGLAVPSSCVKAHSSVLG